MYDALNYSQNTYYGTARTIALGNAVTAVGGDLGTIGINPAGSAVAGYNQFTITPGISISAVGSTYSPEGEWNYNSQTSMNHKRFTMPNIGMSMVFDTGRESGLKSMTFAFVSNQTNNFNNYANAFGTNGNSSKFAELATAACGIEEEYLNKYSSFDMTDIPWDVLVAYQGGLMGSYGQGANYVGNTEVLVDADPAYHYVPGDLVQNSFVTKSGSKNDIVLNMGANISDVLFLGANIGLPTINYRYSENFTESPVEMEKFPVAFEKGDTYFRSGLYAYDYAASVTGIYAKIGAIYRPTDHIRIGAAIQSPTSFVIDESWEEYGRSTFADSFFDDDGMSSPTGEYSYGLRSPYVINAGVAFTLGTFALISADYEMADYSIMKFRETGKEYVDDYYYSEFYEINEVNKLFCGVSHQFRAGAEVKLTPAFALRAGYNFGTSPERYWIDNSGRNVTADDYLGDFNYYHGLGGTLVQSEYYKDYTSSYALGFGYSSPGSFFADFSARMTKYADSIFAPYYDYDGYDANGTLMEKVAPRILNERKLFDFALTFGWRF